MGGGAGTCKEEVWGLPKEVPPATELHVRDWCHFQGEGATITPNYHSQHIMAWSCLAMPRRTDRGSVSPQGSHLQLIQNQNLSGRSSGLNL